MLRNNYIKRLIEGAGKMIKKVTQCASLFTNPTLSHSFCLFGLLLFCWSSIFPSPVDRPELTLADKKMQIYLGRILAPLVEWTILSRPRSRIQKDLWGRNRIEGSEKRGEHLLAHRSHQSGGWCLASCPIWCWYQVRVSPRMISNHWAIVFFA